MKQYCCLNFVILFLLLGILLVFSVAPAQGADLKITSNPSGAQIWLDGANTEQITPYSFSGVKEGHHQIELKNLPNYRNEKRNIIVKPGNNLLEIPIPETSLYYMWLSLPALLLGALMTLFLTIVAVFNGIVIGTFTGWPG